jgi:soluble lytic murein transglycosylase
MRDELLVVLLAFLAIFSLVACGERETQLVEPLIGEATATLQPTPTLVPALAVVEPTAVATEPSSFVEAMVEVAVAQIIPTSTNTPSPTPSPSPTPTATPRAEVRLETAQQSFHNGNYPAVIEQLEAVLPQRSTLVEEQMVDLLYTLGRAYWRDGQLTAAVNTFNDLLAVTAGEGPSTAYFYLGQAQQAAGNNSAAIRAYEAYLQREPIMTAYVQPRIAQLLTGESAVAAYEAALNGEAPRLKQIEIRRQLAQFYLEAEDYGAAIAQYDAIHDLAVTENTKGEMTYLAGSTLLLAGDFEGAYARYQSGINLYPRAYESYLGLVALVEAGAFANEYQRGLVDYYAEAYEPTIAAFNRYIAANPTSYKTDSHLYLAWSYEALGDIASAYTELEKYSNVDAAKAIIEQAKMAARAGDNLTAVDRYDRYLRDFPDGSEAPFAAWWLAALTERGGDWQRAISYYLDLADNYSWHEDAPEAIFRAGWLAYVNGEGQTAVTLWLRAAEAFPRSEFASAARLWLLRTLPELASKQQIVSPTVVLSSTAVMSAGVAMSTSVDLTTTIPITTAVPITATDSVTKTVLDYTAVLSRTRDLVTRSTSSDYYGVRARDIVQGSLPFVDTAPFVMPQDETADQAEAEAWLRGWLGLAADSDVRSLNPVLAQDPRLLVGQELWQLGLYAEAKQELESLRIEHAENALFSYQLALFFRDVGLYRSSIIAASSVLILSGETIFEAPKFIGRLAYPAYYADLIVPLAEQYGYDPRLQFALVRQESLFESVARSGAVAQGLSQVIPATGAYIAEQLDWPDFVNEDLYLPYVGLNFGAYYIAEQLTIFDGHVHAALSAYNAGPGNAARWYNLAGDDLDSYHETVDFGETRLYIERIYVGFVIYSYLYDGAS